LSLFSRRARWLNALFPASVAPQVSDPGSVSDDVSLVQPYDGGGIGIPNPDSMSINFVTTPGAAGSQVVIPQLPDDEYVRIIVAGFALLVGGVPLMNLLATSQGGAGPTIAYSREMQGNGIGRTDVFLDVPPILPPGHGLLFNWAAGTGTTSVNIMFLFIRVPVGTVFYL